MMSIPRNRIIGQVLNLRLPVKRTQLNTTRYVHPVTENCERSALCVVSEALSLNAKNSLSALNFALENKNHETNTPKLPTESLFTAPTLRCTQTESKGNIEHEYALLHALQYLTISSIHLPTCNGKLNAVLPPTENGKNVQITVPSLMQREVSDPAVTGRPLVTIEEPATPTNLEKRAERLIVIRRRKMKKHKLIKLRKRMKFEFAKIRNRREKRKETAFQAELLAQMKHAEDFDAEKWAQDFLERSKSYAKQKAAKEFWDSDEGGRLRYEIYLNTRKIPPDQR